MRVEHMRVSLLAGHMALFLTKKPGSVGMSV